MGLFDKLKGNQEIKLSPKGALALSAMTVIAADGSIEENEIAGLRRVVRGDENAFNQAYKVFKSKTFGECVDLVTKSLEDKQKACVIANLVDIAMADGVLASTEEKLLTSYIAAFKMPEDTVKKIIEAIEVKNNFSVFD